MISDDVIAQIKAAADIVVVISQYVQLRKAGRNFKGLCPFHGEKTPSFSVNPGNQFFYCFGCQKKGDALNFVMEIEGKSFIEACEQLGARFGVEIPKIEENPDDRRRRGERARMLDINKVATEFYRAQLASPAGEPARAYLAKRGVSDEISEKFQLGHAAPDWDLLALHLQSKRVDMQLAEQLGLVAPRGQRQGSYYDRIRDRLVCPIVQPGGEVFGFSSRALGSGPPAPDGNEPPKYINSPESLVYKKSNLLFGLSQARAAMQAQKRAVLVEGNFDVITLHQAGFEEVVAPLGTALTREQITTLKRLTERIVLLYDGDKAGYKATMHALQICVEADVEVLVARRPGHAKSGGAGPLSDGVDPDSMVAAGGAEQLREAVDRAQGGIEYFAFEVWGKARNNADARTRALEDAARLVAKVASPIKRDLIVATLASAMGVDGRVVWSAIERAQQGGRTGPHPGPPGRAPQFTAGGAPAPDRGDAPASDPRAQTVPPTEEVEVIALLSDHPSLIATAEADKAFWLLTDARLRDMYSAARDGQPLHEHAPVLLPKSTAERVMSGKYADSKDPRADLINMTTNLALRAGKAPLHDTLSQLKDAERRGEKDRARLLTQLLVAERRGDRTLVESLKLQLAETSSGKQDD